MAGSTASRLAAALFAALAAAATLPGCCFDFDLSLEPASVAMLMVGGEEVIDAPMEPSLEPAAQAVRQQVREAGFTDPWPMLSADGRGLIVEDRADAGAPLLVWDDWTAEAPPRPLAGATSPQLISSRHFIFDRRGERWVASLENPRRAAQVDPAFDPLNVRAMPRGERWAAILHDQLYIGSLDKGVTEASTAVQLGVVARRIAVFEDVGLALVETADDMVTAWDLTSATDTGVRFAGSIEWPWASAVAPPPEDEEWLQLWPINSVPVTTAHQTWLVGSAWFGGLHIAAAPWRTSNGEGGALALLGASAYRGIVWPPRQDRETLGLIPYQALTHWKPPPEEPEPGDDE